MGDAIKTYVLVSEKKWHDTLFDQLQQEIPARWIRIVSKEEFTWEILQGIRPDLVFIPHWSHIIPAAVFTQAECIVFHMTDLPFGRGGSPLQNLIVRGYDQTRISAIKVTQGIDTGPVYLKASLSLAGSAEEIFIRATGVIKDMIHEIIEKRPEPMEQQGDPVIFKRRKPEDGNIAQLKSITEAYDFIRMLDAEGYPQAFIETEHFRLEFTRASLKSGKTILADVRIIQK